MTVRAVQGEPPGSSLLLLLIIVRLGIQGRQSPRPAYSAPITAAAARSECRILLRRARRPLAVLNPPLAAVLVTAVTCQGSTTAAITGQSEQQIASEGILAG